MLYEKDNGRDCEILCEDDDLRDRVRYIENDGCDLWEWSEKVYETVKNG